MKKIPYGIINFKELREKDYLFVDKTEYIEKLEDYGEKIMYLRPGRFGKSLFTSMLFYYYDISSEGLFDSLFKGTYIYNKSTPNKNNYYVLKLDFSGIEILNNDKYTLETIFKDCVITGIQEFCARYGFDYKIDTNMGVSSIMRYFLSYITMMNLDKKLYIIVDEYDNFTNAILRDQGDEFKDVVGDSGFVKAFYATIKVYIKEGSIDRIFMTGICPITLNAVTTGFNIAKDITTHPLFNEMIGLTQKEVLNLINDIKDDKVYPIMKENYDGYLFNIEGNKTFNATLVMYFLGGYYTLNKIPKKLMDDNIAFNYDKIDNFVTLQNNKFYQEVLEHLLKEGRINGILKSKFNLNMDFDRNDIISLLFYFGYLTIEHELTSNMYTFKIPNLVMESLYNEYFVALLSRKNINIGNDIDKLYNAVRELRKSGSINELTNMIQDYLKEEGDRTVINFDEKYIQLYYTSLLRMNGEYKVYSEFDLKEGYCDLLLLKKDNMDVNYEYLIEFKYIKKEDYSDKVIETKRNEAIEQLNKYNGDSRIDKNSLKKLVIIFVGRECQEIKEA